MTSDLRVLEPSFMTDLHDDLLQALEQPEGDWEFKSARGGLPGSVWSTISAMANSQGGHIALGVVERDDTFVIEGVKEADRLRQQILDQAHNRGKLSAPLLGDAEVVVLEHEGARLVVITVPRAARHQRPVFLDNDPFRGTFRRAGEGDYRCTEAEVRRMFADASDVPADRALLEGFGAEDLDGESISAFRHRMSAREPSHPWLALSVPELLLRLHAIELDRSTGRSSLTLAGALVFGSSHTLRSTAVLPHFHLDYRERLSADPEIRWTHRITEDGRWECNLLQFFSRVVLRLTADLPVPFALGPDLFRRDTPPAHKALREALVNALIHADYHGQGGVVIERSMSGITLSNPGTLLLSREQLWTGGLSECRNPTVQTMFQLIGAGERAGSGMDTIRQGWDSLHWRRPRLTESSKPDRVTLGLSFESLLPAEAVRELSTRFGAGFEALDPEARLALVLAFTAGEITNAGLQELSEAHGRDLTTLLKRLCDAGFLVGEGRTRARRYRLGGGPSTSLPAHSPSSGPDSPSGRSGSPSRGSDSPSSRSGSPSSRPDSPSSPTALVQPTPTEASRFTPRVLQLCDGEFRTAKELSEALGCDRGWLRKTVLRPLFTAGVLEALHPDSPNSPRQAYRKRQGGP